MWKDHGERGISFHTMKELLQMEERHKEKEKDKKDGNKKDKKRDINTQNGLVSGLLHMRDSNIYKAVVLARELEGGGNNPLRSGRFQRFFKSFSCLTGSLENSDLTLSFTVSIKAFTCGVESPVAITK